MMKFSYPEGATPLEYDELADLIPQHITAQDQLNAWEQKNILFADQWARKQENIVSVDFMVQLHKHMFNQTWKWAGKFRRSMKNIGIDWHYIPIELKKLCDDAVYQLKYDTFSIDEIAVRIHHRLVWIHPFPNGNGRHGRLVADILVMKYGRHRFSWGINQDLYKATPTRKLYIEALQRADHGDYTKLLIFARS